MPKNMMTNAQVGLPQATRLRGLRNIKPRRAAWTNMRLLTHSRPNP